MISRVLHAVANVFESISWWFKVRAEQLGEKNEIAR